MRLCPGPACKLYHLDSCCHTTRFTTVNGCWFLTTIATQALVVHLALHSLSVSRLEFSAQPLSHRMVPRLRQWLSPHIPHVPGPSDSPPNADFLDGLSSSTLTSSPTHLPINSPRHPSTKLPAVPRLYRLSGLAFFHPVLSRLRRGP